MPRADLLALDADELAAMTNRGTVKRAIRELEAGDHEYSIEETDASLVVTWSDGITCPFPADAAIQDAICTSGVLGISRHLIRSILAYQQDSENTSDDLRTEVPQPEDKVCVAGQTEAQNISERRPLPELENATPKGCLPKYVTARNRLLSSYTIHVAFVSQFHMTCVMLLATVNHDSCPIGSLRRFGRFVNWRFISFQDLS